MALEDLLAALEEEAEEKARRILEEARAEAARLEEEAERRLARRRREFLSRREAEIRNELAAGMARARRRIREGVLAAREEMLRRIRERVEEGLPRAGESRAYRDSLGNRLAAALAYVGEDGVVVGCPPSLSEAVRAHLAGRDDVEVDEDPQAPAGFRVRSRDGRVEVDETLVSRLARLWRELAIELTRRVEDGA